MAYCPSPWPLFDKYLVVLTAVARSLFQLSSAVSDGIRFSQFSCLYFGKSRHMHDDAIYLDIPPDEFWKPLAI